jgi:hypothetical protein
VGLHEIFTQRVLGVSGKQKEWAFFNAPLLANTNELTHKSIFSSAEFAEICIRVKQEVDQL